MTYLFSNIHQKHTTGRHLNTYQNLYNLQFPFGLYADASWHLYTNNTARQNSAVSIIQ